VRSADDVGFVEEVFREACAGVENFDADEAVVFPVEDDEAFDAGRRGALRVLAWPVMSWSVSRK
jgi:hypothetical protein